MRITRNNNMYQLTFMPTLFPVNCYLVEEEAELTLVDAALPYSAKGIMKAAERIGKPIKSIIVTHAHEDHVGALDALKEMMPQVKIYISQRDAKLMDGDQSLEPREANTPIRGGVPKKLKARADYTLREGDRVGSLQAIASPGHTPGSMSFLDVRDNALIVGDAFQTRGGIAVSGQVRPLFPFPALGTWDKQTSLQSAVKLLQLDPTLLACGHGLMLTQPAAAMKEAISIAENNLQSTTVQRSGNDAS